VTKKGKHRNKKRNTSNGRGLLPDAKKGRLNVRWQKRGDVAHSTDINISIQRETWGNLFSREKKKK